MVKKLDTPEKDADVSAGEVEPQTDAAGPQPIPVPSGITATWFPALVVLPGQRLPLPGKQRVYATPDGLYVYSKVPQDQDQLNQATPFWFAPIAYDETPLPPANYSALAANGFGISTTEGMVMITVPRGCSTCGMRQMAAWQPRWAHTQLPANWKDQPR